MSLFKLKQAEEIAIKLFEEVERRELISPGKMEMDLNKEVYDLAKELFGIEKHWHKRIVRCGKNTLLPYDQNPPDRVIAYDDILFFDFGPIIENWEADLGRTYVIGNDPLKLKLKQDIESAWNETAGWVRQHSKLSSADLFNYAVEKARTYGWEFGGEIAGHLIGEFPHEKIEKGSYGLYVHPDNEIDLYATDPNGDPRHWILEMHFVDRKNKIGAFYEQLLI